MGSCTTKPAKEKFVKRNTPNQPSFLQQVLSVNGVQTEIQPTMEPKQLISILHKSAKDSERNVVICNEESERNIQLTVVTKSSILQRRTNVKAKTMMQIDDTSFGKKSPSGSEKKKTRLENSNPSHMKRSLGDANRANQIFLQSESIAYTQHTTMPSLFKNPQTISLHKQQMTISGKSIKSLEGIE